MTINATAMWLLAMYIAMAEERGVPGDRLAGHDPERHRQGVPLARHLHLRTRSVAPAHRRRHHPLGARTCPRWNPINVCPYHLQEAGATPVQELAYGLATAVGVLDAVRDSGPGVARGVPRGRRADLVLHRRRHPLRRRGVQDARLHRDVGPDLPRALRRDRREAAPVPLRRAGELARPHRGPAREQRAAHRARDARRHPRARLAGARDPAPVLERGARPPPSVGPAVVAAHAAGARVRDRPARVRRHLRGLDGHRGEDAGARRRGRGRAAVGARRRRCVRDDRRDQGAARAEPRRARARASSRATSRSSA